MKTDPGFEKDLAVLLFALAAVIIVGYFLAKANFG